MTTHIPEGLSILIDADDPLILDMTDSALEREARADVCAAIDDLINGTNASAKRLRKALGQISN